MACLGRAVAAGLLIAGKREETFVENARFDEVAHVCRSTAGRTIEAIVSYYNPSCACNGTAKS